MEAHAYDGRVVDGTSRWMEVNQRYLSAAIGVVRAHVEHAAERPTRRRRRSIADADRALADAAKAAAAVDDPPALETVASVFGLSDFERAVLVLCAGVELEADLARLCGAGPTFGLALGSLPDAHWGAAAPGAPLRRWRLVEVGAGATLASSPLRISERCLFELIGTPQLDRDLEAVLEPVERRLPADRPAVRRPSPAWWRRGRHHGTGRGHRRSAVHGGTRSDRRAIVAAAAAAAGLELYALATSALPGDAAALRHCRARGSGRRRCAPRCCSSTSTRPTTARRRRASTASWPTPTASSW